MSKKDYYRKNYQEALNGYELIKAGAEVVLCKMIQAGEFDVNKAMEVCRAIENAKTSVEFFEKELKEAEAEEGGDENA